MLTAYQHMLSPVFHAGVPGACRFQPTCSEYAAIAVTEHGWLRGTAMAAWRVLRCNPLNRHAGFDPVPVKPGCRVQVTGYGAHDTKQNVRSGNEFSPQWMGAQVPEHR